MLDGTSRAPPPKTVLYSSAVPSAEKTEKPQSNGPEANVMPVEIAPAVVGYSSRLPFHRAVPPKARASSSYAAVNPQLLWVDPM